MDTDNNCDICYKIICPKCGWQASREEEKLVQCGKLSECPTCGWRPENG